MYAIELCETDKVKFAEQIIRQLPDWFGIEESIFNYLSDIATMPTYFATDAKGDKLGFATLHFHNSATAEIHVMGVLPQWHGMGIGKLLVERLAEMAKSSGCRYLTVKTLGESHPDRQFYSRTRQFYLSAGFLPLEESMTIWNGTPCLLMALSLH